MVDALMAWVGDDAARAQLVVAVLGVLLVVPVLGFAAYMWRTAARSPNARLTRLLAIALGAGAAGLAIVLWRIAAFITSRQ